MCVLLCCKLGDVWVTVLVRVHECVKFEFNLYTKKDCESVSVYHRYISSYVKKLVQLPTILLTVDK